MKLSIVAMVALVLGLCSPLVALGQNCISVTATTPVDIGPYDPGKVAHEDATGYINFKCTPASYQISASPGSTPGGSFAARKASNGSNTIEYNLYTNSSRTLIWGDGNGSSTPMIATIAGNAQDRDIAFYARVRAGQNATADTNYTDTVSVTVYSGVTPVATLALTIRIQVMRRCFVVASDLNFGNYDPVVAHSAAPLDATSTVQVFCTAGTNASVGLDQGTSGNRRMQGPSGNTLLYRLYLDAGRTTEWTLAPPGLQSGSGNGPTVPLGGGSGWTVFGRVPGGQDAIVGSYSDTVSVVINY